MLYGIKRSCVLMELQDLGCAMYGQAALMLDSGITPMVQLTSSNYPVCEGEA